MKKSILLFFVYMVLITNIVAESGKSLDPELAANVIEMPINSDSDILRKQAFIDALKVVLVKASNNPNVVNLPVVKNAFLKPEFYVKQFSYVSKDMGTGKPALFLKIVFNPLATDKLLKRNPSKEDATISGKPLTLVWLVEDFGTPRIIIDEEVGGGLMTILKKKAQELGLSTISSNDLQDIVNIKPQDFCSLNEKVIRKVSSRYETSTIIVGCIKRSFLGKTWSSRWLLLQGLRDIRFSFTGESPESIVTLALPSIAKNIIDVVTPVSGQEETRVILHITNVNGLDQYNEIVRYLRGFDKIIKQVDLVNLSATAVDLSLNVIGGQPTLTSILTTASKLVPEVDMVASPPGVDLSYKWNTLDNEQFKTTSAQPVS